MFNTALKTTLLLAISIPRFCGGDHQPVVAPDGNSFACYRDPFNAPSDRTDLYQWRYDADAGWTIGAHSQIDGFSGSVVGPGANLIATYDATGDAGLYAAQDGAWNFAGAIQNAPPNNYSGSSNPSMMSLDGGVILIQSFPFDLLENTGSGYAPVDVTPASAAIDQGGSTMIYLDAGVWTIARNAAGDWSAQTPTDLGGNRFVLSPSANYVAGCGNNVASVYSLSQANELAQVAAVSAPCDNVLVTDDGAIVWTGQNKLYRAGPPSYDGGVLVSNNTINLQSISADAGAIALTGSATLPDGGYFEDPHAFYLGPQMLRLAPGAALTSMSQPLPMPETPVLSAVLHGQPTDFAAVNAITVQFSGSLAGKVTTARLYWDVDGNGALSASDRQLGSRGSSGSDAGTFVFDNLALTVGRTPNPYDYDGGVDPGSPLLLPSDAYLLVTAEVSADNGSGQLQAAIDPAKIQATSVSLSYGITTAGAVVTGAPVAAAAPVVDAGTPPATDAGTVTTPDAGTTSGSSSTGCSSTSSSSFSMLALFAAIALAKRKRLAR